MSGKLDLLIINIGGTSKKVYQDLSKEISAVEPPFWAALTAGFIRERGYSVEILEANLITPSLHLDQCIRRYSSTPDNLLL